MSHPTDATSSVTSNGNVAVAPTTATLSPADAAAHRAASHLRPVLLPMPERLVVNYDNYGSYWGVDTVTATMVLIGNARKRGERIDEWTTTDRAGHPIRVVRIADPDWLDTISVIPLLPTGDTVGNSASATTGGC